MFERDQRMFSTLLIGSKNQMPPADVEPTNDRVIVGHRGDHFALESLWVSQRPVDGDDRTSRQDWEHGIIEQPDGDGFARVGQPCAVGQDVPFDSVGVEGFSAQFGEGHQADGNEVGRGFAGELVRRRRYRVARLLFQLFEAAPDQLDRRQVGQVRRVIVASEVLPFAGQQPDRVGARLIDECEQDFGRDGYPGFVVVPGSSGEVESSSKLRATMLTEEFLPDIPEPPRDQRFHVDSNF